MDEAVNKKLADWQTVLSEHAGELFKQTGRGLLLSRVPSLLRSQGIEPRDFLQGRKLREFIQSEGGPGLTLIQSEVNPLLWAILPADAKPVEPYSRYFPSPEARSEERPPRFQPAVWQAFIRTKAPQMRRWLFLAAPTRFEDFEEADEPIGGTEVEEEFIVDQEQFFRSTGTVIGNIEKWAAKHELNVHELLVRPKGTDSQTGPSRSVLIEFLRALRPEERHRIAIPADIAARLLGV
jgi:hypothetical protein